MNRIHSTAIISNKASLGRNIKIGPYCIVKDNVTRINVDIITKLDKKKMKWNNLISGSLNMYNDMKQKELSEEELKKIKDLGDLENLMKEFKKRLEEQEKHHHGGSKWIGTAGTYPFGND